MISPELAIALSVGFAGLTVLVMVLNWLFPKPRLSFRRKPKKLSSGPTGLNYYVTRARNARLEGR